MNAITFPAIAKEASCVLEKTMANVNVGNANAYQAGLVLLVTVGQLMKHVFPLVEEKSAPGRANVNVERANALKEKKGDILVAIVKNVR